MYSMSCTTVFYISDRLSAVWTAVRTALQFNFDTLIVPPSTSAGLFNNTNKISEVVLEKYAVVVHCCTTTRAKVPSYSK